MSRTSVNGMKIVDGNLVEKILEQGQKLRNSMVESILKNDPFSVDLLYDKHFNTPKSTESDILIKRKEEYCFNEKTDLQSFRLPSSETQKEPIINPVTCLGNCSTCTTYSAENLKCHLRRKNCSDLSDIATNKIKSKYYSKNVNLLKYVDSLKVSLKSIDINEAGVHKILSKTKSKTFKDLDQTFFIEYKVPNNLTKKYLSKSKVDSGLIDNHVRICSRRSNEAIYFNYVQIHEVSGLYNIDLEACELKFAVSFKSSKPKMTFVLGYASFHLDSFVISNNLTCNRGLPIHLSDNPQVIIGTLKVTLQLGCGKLYFGQEFVDTITTSSLIHSVVLGTDDNNSELTSESNINIDNRNNIKGLDVDTSYLYKAKPKPLINRTKEKIAVNTGPQKLSPLVIDSSLQQAGHEVQILFGLVYVSEAHFLSDPIDSFISCKPFLQNENCTSRLVINSSSAEYKFRQLIPILYEESILSELRENYMIIEFWESCPGRDFVFGLTKIPLHQFYLTYRNPVIVKYLIKNKLPVIGTDWWEPIFAINSQEHLGQVHVLTALGTEEQIRNLEKDRGFYSNIVKIDISRKNVKNNLRKQKIDANVSLNKNTTAYVDKGVNTDRVKIDCLNKPSIDRNTNLSKSTSLSLDKAVNTDKSTKLTEKLDVGVQFVLKDSMEVNREEKPESQTQSMLNSFLGELLAQKQKNIYVENSTNTDSPDDMVVVEQKCKENSSDVMKTSDLLDSLQKALSLDFQAHKTHKLSSFRARIHIDSANQLPCRKKCKSRKTRNKSSKSEDNLFPSTYVSFESLNDVKLTHVISKSVNPKWDFKTDVDLPIDLLTNAQKRLIFKVWKKSTNTTMQPNLETDLILGFAALDLTVLIAGLPDIQGWFNIMDFSGNCNGQIKIHFTPLENLTRFQTTSKNYVKEDLQNHTTLPQNSSSIGEPGELLNRALKRKFTELDEITQRLRLRLSEVTNDDTDNSSDEVAEQFQRDIDTICIEEDFDLINFEERTNQDKSKETNKSETSMDITSLLSVASNASVSAQTTTESDKMQTCGVKNVSEAKEATLSLDQELLEGKQRIDTLLGKLSLMSKEASFPSRYVSGCSVNQEASVNVNSILEELDHVSRPNIQAGSSFDPTAFQQLYAGSVYSGDEQQASSGSDTSVITDFSECRLAPDGQGTVPDDIHKNV